MPIHDHIDEPGFRQSRRYWNGDRFGRSDLYVDCQERCLLDHDYLWNQWRWQRRSRVSSGVKFPGREERNDDDRRSPVHRVAGSGRSAGAYAAESHANSARAHSTCASDARAAGTIAGVHVLGQRAIPVVPVWRRRRSIDIGLRSEWMRVDGAEQCVVDHDHVGRKWKRQRHCDLQRRVEQRARADGNAHRGVEDDYGDASARSGRRREVAGPRGEDGVGDDAGGRKRW